MIINVRKFAGSVNSDTHANMAGSKTSPRNYFHYLNKTKLFCPNLYDFIIRLKGTDDTEISYNAEV